LFPTDINKRLNLLKYFKDLTNETGVIKEKGLIFKRHKAVSLEAKRQKRRFINDYLKFDGVFILRMISMLTSELVGTEVLHELWSKRAVYGNKFASSSEDPNNPFTHQSDRINKFKELKETTQSTGEKSLLKMRERPTSLNPSFKSSGAPVYMHSCSEPGSSILATKKIPLLKKEPSGSKFKKLIQKNFLTKHVSSQFSPMQINQGLTDVPTVNRAKQHRLSLSIQTRAFPKSTDVPDTGETDLNWKNLLRNNRTSLRAINSSHDSPAARTRMKRVVFASNVRHTVENFSNSSKESEPALKSGLNEDKYKNSRVTSDLDE